MYRIIATHDIIGKDREYLTDVTTEPISDETVESLDDCVKRLHEIATEGKANSIEVIYPHIACSKWQSNWHTSFYTEDHPYAEVELIFDEIDQWAEDRRQPRPPHIGAEFGSDTQQEQILENGDLPF